MKVISKRGDADFSSLAEAMTWVEAQPAGPLLLLLRMDAYDEPLIIRRDQLYLVGEAEKRTFINTQQEPVIEGKDVMIEHLTVKVTDCEGKDQEPREIVYGDLQAKNRPKYCFLLGDETMASWIKEMPDEKRTEVCMMNDASTKRVITSKLLGMVELCLHPGDTLFIQLGKHDSDADIALHTQPRTTFTDYLGMMVDAARMRQAAPVLLLSSEAPQEYAAAMRDFAAWRGVRCIAMTGDTQQDAARVKACLS